jgi:hypothetical protein
MKVFLLISLLKIRVVTIGDSKRAELMVNLARNKPKTIKSLIYDIEGSSTIVFLRNKYHYHSPNLESFNHM